jgi:hypothetical protein
MVPDPGGGVNRGFDGAVCPGRAITRGSAKNQGGLVLTKNGGGEEETGEGEKKTDFCLPLCFR